MHGINLCPRDNEIVPPNTYPLEIFSWVGGPPFEQLGLDGLLTELQENLGSFVHWTYILHTT